MYHIARKYRLYPNEQQAQFIRNAFGQSRFIYNWALGIKKDAYEKDKTKISLGELDKMFREMRNNDPEKAWLKDVPERVHNYALRNLDSAFKNFFRGFGYPKFKSKYDYHRSATNDVYGSCKIDFEKSTVDFGGKCRGIRAVIDREFDGRPKSFTFSITPSGEFYVSIVIECDGELPEKKAIIPETTIGLDLNVVNLAYSSDGEITANPQPLEKELKKLKRMQRAFCKMEKGSKRREKQRIRIAKLHQHIANKRKDYAHKLTHALIMRYDTIVLEDLDIKGMMKNPRLARQIADCAWGYTGTYLEYKANLYGKNVIRVDQYYASTKICNSCGGYNDTVKLRNRTWKCTHCETDNEVDFNAALNLKTEGLKIVNDVASVK